MSKDINIENKKVLEENICIIFEKEMDDLCSRRSENGLTWFVKEDEILYDNYNSLFNLYSTIHTNKDLKEFFLDYIFDSLFDEEKFISETRSSGYSHLAFFLLINLNCDDDAIDNLKRRSHPSTLLPLIIGAMLKVKDSYFNDNQLKGLKVYLEEELKNFEPIYFGDLINLIISDIIRKRFDNLNYRIKAVNIEINNDKKSVQEKINYLGFDDKLSRLLDEVDKYLLSDTSEFVNAAMIGNLRAFMENVFKDIARRICTRNSEKIPKGENRSEMGDVRNYLKTKLKLHDNEHKFINDFINILHTEGGHSFVSEKEYFRLARNIAIEIALLFLSKYEKLL